MRVRTTEKRQEKREGNGRFDLNCPNSPSSAAEDTKTDYLCIYSFALETRLACVTTMSRTMTHAGTAPVHSDRP